MVRFELGVLKGILVGDSSHFWVWAFNDTSNIISIILWWSVLLVEETGAHRENH
jgi:hypothetical protein